MPKTRLTDAQTVSVREMEVKVVIRYYFTPIRKKIKRTVAPIVGVI